jgi:hypothetical protein
VIKAASPLALDAAKASSMRPPIPRPKSLISTSVLSVEEDATERADEGCWWLLVVAVAKKACAVRGVTRRSVATQKTRCRAAMAGE